MKRSMKRSMKKRRNKDGMTKEDEIIPGAPVIEEISISNKEIDSLLNEFDNHLKKTPDYPLNFSKNLGDIYLYGKLSDIFAYSIDSENMIPSLVIDSVQTKEDKRIKGLFKNLLLRLENWSKSNKRVVMIANISNKILLEYLERNGYKIVGGFGSPSAYKDFR